MATLQRQTEGEFGGPDPAAQRSPLPRVAATAAAHAAAALVLIWPAFWNGFPLVFADTGTYLGQALLRYLGWDRPPFYSFFLLITDWQLSLWLPVFAQGLLVAHLLGLVLRQIGRPEPLALPVVAAALAVLTPLPWVAAQLMPDLFSGITVLTLWLLGFRQAAMSRAGRIYIFMLALLAVAVHQSHLPLALGLALLGGLLLVIRHGWRKALRPALWMAAPALITTMALTGINGAVRGKLSPSPYGTVFLAARVLYDGPGMAVARRECPDIGWKLCAVLDHMPREHNVFLWRRDAPVWKDFGGPMAWSPEARAIVMTTLRAAPGAVLAAALRNTLEQLMLFTVGDGLEPWPPPQGPVPVVARFFPQELDALEASRQQTGHLWADARTFAPLHLAAFLAGIGIMLWLMLLRWPRLPLRGTALAVMVLTGTVANAAITGTLSGPTPRYQSRIVWILPFAAAAMLAGFRPMPRAASVNLRPRFPD